MDEPTPEAADEPMPAPRQIVRRFDSRKNVKRARKHGIHFDVTKGNGIPAASTDIEPVNPDRIKEATGARNADAWIDIDVTGKQVLRRVTKAGRKEIVIREDIDPGQIVASGRTVQTDRETDEGDAT